MIFCLLWTEGLSSPCSRITASRWGPRLLHCQKPLNSCHSRSVWYIQTLISGQSTLPIGERMLDVLLQLDVIRIICSHEHFIALSLPFGSGLAAGHRPVSPSPSVLSALSHVSWASTIPSSHDQWALASLSSEFRRQHFLIGLVLSDLATVLDME